MNRPSLFRTQGRKENAKKVEDTVPVLQELIDSLRVLINIKIFKCMKINNIQGSANKYSKLNTKKMSRN